MLTRKLSLPFSDPAVRLTLLLPNGIGKPAMVVLPGGGYRLCAPAEGAPVAKRFAEAGYAVFLLEYSTLSTDPISAIYPGPLRQLALTMAHIRAHAEEYDIDPELVYLFGASAGAHLAASFGNRWREPSIYEGIAPAEALRPEAIVLLYPALDPDSLPETQMPEAIYGHPAPFSGQELMLARATLHVGPQTPPAILFHSVPDPSVPVENSLRMFQALRREGIPCELHLFGSGEHAYGLGAGTPAAVWPELALRFLEELRSHPERFDPSWAREQRAARHRGN